MLVGEGSISAACYCRFIVPMDLGAFSLGPFLDRRGLPIEPGLDGFGPLFVGLLDRLWGVNPQRRS